MLIPARSTHAYPIVHPDFLWHNILLNDSYEIVGIIDWEFARTAPIEGFAARMNLYGLFNSRLATQDFAEEGRQYIGDVAGAEIEMNVSQKLSEAFGSIFGDLGLCMQFYDEGRALLFDSVLDRAENLYQTQEQ
uniref:Aminoglycoside phosphotransferase domain-containing protein n=1 Tax=Bionectria ochroleuca TaxID=29856 RepID=A0A8H7NPL4_BIOOC